MNYETYFPRNEEDYLQFKYDIGSVTTRQILHSLCTFKSGRVLEIGPGAYGLFLSELPVACELHAVDISRATLESAARYDEAKRVTWHLGELSAQGFAEGYFDAIISAHVIEHIEDDAAFVRECTRILKQGGELIILTPSHPSGLAPKGEWETYGHYRNYNLRMVEALAQVSPNLTLETVGFYHYILGQIWNRFKFVLHAVNYPFRWYILRDNQSFYGRKIYQKIAPALGRFLTLLESLIQTSRKNIGGWQGIVAFRIRKALASKC